MDDLLKDLHEWIRRNLLDVKFLSKVLLELDGKKYYVVFPKDGIIVKTLEVKLNLNIEDRKVICDYYLFEFGGIWYYSNSEDEGEVEFNLFKYKGKAKLEITEYDFVHLGIHGKYELLNGSGHYDQWIEKSKFFGYNKAIGICEKNTLAGILQFQLDCKKEKIQPILGETITIKIKDSFYEGKVFVRNDVGWRNLLLINTEINVINKKKYILEKRLLELGEGLVFVFSNDFPLSKEKITIYQKSFGYKMIYYQIDLVEWNSNEKDKNHLLNIKNYYENYYIPESMVEEGESLGAIEAYLPCVLINDSYYLDKGDYIIKKKLNSIGAEGLVLESRDQYFKSVDDFLFTLSDFFKEGDENFFNFFLDCINNASGFATICEFQIELGNFKMPLFTRGHLLPPYCNFSNNEDLFWFLIGEGIEKYKIEEKEKKDEYYERIEREMDLINRGGFIDYFLILWDIVTWAERQSILVGLGRGSAGGSLVSYLLGITKIDPLVYDLLFERFLNEGRLSKKKKIETIIIQDENNLEVELDFDQKVTIFKENKEVRIYANELQTGDKIISY